MRIGKPPSAPGPSELSASDRLESWKEIAAYLKRDESTVRRWEKEGLPVHRHVHKKKATVYSYKLDIDVWWNSGRTTLESPEAAAVGSRRTVAWWVVAGFLLVLPGLVGFNVGGIRDRMLGRPAAGKISSLAVLPLENLTGNPEQGYLAAAMTEGLITELAKISSLRVISRQSVMQYEGSKKRLGQIAQELKVDAVVEGAVVRQGDRISVMVQLIQVRPERQLWAERYERDLTSILILQSEVARAIAGEIRVELPPDKQALLPKARTVNQEAHEAYVRGLFFMEKVDQEGIARGIEYSRRAIRFDPTYAPAYAALADGYNRAVIHGYEPAREGYPAVKAAVSKALQLDDTLAEGHILAGVVKFRFDWDWTGAERDLKRALELSPNSSRAHLGYSTYLLAMGRTDEAIRVAQRNVELDPLTPQRQIDLAWKLAYAGRHDEAITQLRKALELAPNFAEGYELLGQNYAAKGMYAEATAMCETALNLPFEGPVWSSCGRVYLLAGKRQKTLNILKNLVGQDPVSPYQLALLYDALGDRKQALQHVVQAFETRAPEMCFLRIDPFSAELRSDPRFQDVLRRMDFPQ